MIYSHKIIRKTAADYEIFTDKQQVDCVSGAGELIAKPTTTVYLTSASTQATMHQLRTREVGWGLQRQSDLSCEVRFLGF